LALDPTLYLDEIAAYVREQHAIDISFSTISRCLKARSVFKKVVRLPSNSISISLLTIMPVAKTGSRAQLRASRLLDGLSYEVDSLPNAFS
jgi:hypothetical protein